jgi:hypothetical protein
MAAQLAASQEGLSSVSKCGYVKCSTLLYEQDGLRLSMCVSYSWEMALNVGFDTAFSDT